MKSRFRTLIAMLASCLLLWSASADAHLSLKTFKGGFTSSAVPCEAELCTGGPLTGGLEGSLAWTMTRMEATDDPDVVKLIGVNVVTTATGTLTGTDYTLWNLVTGDFVDVTIISSGTGAYAGAKGTLVIQGGFDAATGTGTSNYVALVKLTH
jgi:hypothetical protein